MRAPLTLLALLALAAPAGAQRAGVWAPPPLAVPDERTGSAAADAPLPATPSLPRVRGTPWWAPLASAALPGSGQAVLGRRRAAAYLAMELFLVTQYVRARDDGRAHRREYRRLARIAREGFTTTFPTGDFEYYETMEKYAESGAFDADPGPAFVPEADTTTFNGITWWLARRTYWDDPEAPPDEGSFEYRRALDFYRRRAYGPSFEWSWRDASLEQDLFQRTIRSSNSAFRLATDYLATIIANHALSAVDAFVSVRLERSPSSPEAPAGGAAYRVDVRVPWAPLGRPRGGSGERP
jgi:hypothetical protein